MSADRHALCADLGHPGVTYNPLHDYTSCLCGANVQPGNTAVCGVTCCGGPLAPARRQVTPPADRAQVDLDRRRVTDFIAAHRRPLALFEATS